MFGGLKELNLRKYIFRVLKALQQLVKNSVKWPSEERFEELRTKWNVRHLPGLQNMVCAVDGTEIRIGRPFKNAIKNPH